MGLILWIHIMTNGALCWLRCDPSGNPLKITPICPLLHLASSVLE